MRTRIRLFGQIPSFLWGIRRERLWLKKFESTRKVSLVISDNRYGFYSSTAPSVLITHQLNIRSGFGKAIDRLMNYLNLRLMKHFFECWVPDFLQAPGLSGDLGHPRRIPDIPVRYIGCLSRFTPCEQQKNEHILIVLSGPEPQRSIFEQLLLDQLSGITEKLFFVRGVDISSPLPDVPSHVTLMNFASSAQLNDLVCRARFVVARCGYTTVMDLFKTKQKGILIPTPGQPEQEYLARHLHASRLAYTVDQKKFNLYESINAASDFDYRIFEGNMNEYKNVIDAFAERIL
ncbi:MAG TPA: glycosyltransferase [Flavitalea sp.]|nr:glycosyltransferase [Flavitalea sp.]